MKKMYLHRIECTNGAVHVQARIDRISSKS